MNSGTDKIVSKIMSEAQVKADEKLQIAEAETKTIIINGEKKAEVEKSKVLDSGKKQSDMRYQQIISEAKMNARRAELGAKEEVIEQAFNKAKENLKNLASNYDNEYAESLKKMIKEAVMDIGEDEIIVQFNASDNDKIKNDIDKIATEISDNTRLEIGDPIDVIGGVIVKTKNGDIEVNNTIESRLARFKKLLRNDVANILFNS